MVEYIKRKFDDYLLNWKHKENRKPLIVKGARQVGKTCSILHFANENYPNVIYINFVEQPAFRNILANGYSVNEVIKQISYNDNALRFIPQQTLIFFDEIQSYPDIVTTLKFFQIDGRFDVICSGSLLGINYKQIESISVGYKEEYTLESFDFEEFLSSLGYERDFEDNIYNHMCRLEPFNDNELNIYNNLFMDYITLGGMPEVIKTYKKNKTFEGILSLQKEILAAYKEDIKKYISAIDQKRIIHVFQAIVPQLSKENKKFMISKVAHGARSHQYEGAIEWLIDSGLVNISYCLNFPELPLKMNFDIDRYKLYFFDTGLFISQLDEEVQTNFRQDRNLGICKGGLYENIVAEAFKKSEVPLYYYSKNNSTLEEDFFIRNLDYLIPVEVKAKNSKSKSLRVLIDSDHYPDIQFGIKLVNGNIGYHHKIFTFPYFCSFLIKKFVNDFDFKNFVGKQEI